MTSSQRRMFGFGRNVRSTNTTRASRSRSPESLDTETDQSFPPSPDGGAATANILSSKYAQNRRKLMDLTSSLRSMGAEALIELPRIVVIGGQSAGKSSLVEAVTGINVPRDSGTCTRCPMECTIASTSTTWACKISLRYDYDNTAGQPLPISHSHSKPFGPKIFDKSKVEIWLRRAQAAILSPHVDASTFLDKTHEELKAFMKDEKAKVKKFSKNKVCIDIEDADATDLAFVDLPGLIQNESEDTIALIRDLVVTNIRQENTIILVTVPVSDDMENQQSVKLAKEADPEGRRTIVVLTKPDALPVGATSSRQKWKDIIEGREHKLNHGYYCVRLPDDDERERGVSRAEAELNAKRYLDSTAPWSQISDRGRFGVQNLITDVSKLLMRVIEKALPDIKQKVNALLAATNKDLSALPVPPLSATANATTEVLLRISEFVTRVKTLVHGGEKNRDMIHTNRDTYTSFKGQIRLTAPDFRPFENVEDYYAPNWEDPSNKTMYRGSKKLFLTEPMSLKDVRAVIKNCIDWQLPGFVPFEAMEFLVDRFVKIWEEPALALFEEITTELNLALGQCIQGEFSQFKQLESAISDIVQDELQVLEKSARADLLKLLEQESTPLFTQNLHYLTASSQKWLQKYTDARKNPTQYSKELDVDEDDDASVIDYCTHQSQTERRVLTDLASLGYNGLNIPDLVRLHPADQYGQELQLMADVRGYFQVAYKRIIDNVPMNIEHSFNQPFSKNLQNTIYKGLRVGSTTDEEMKELLSEDPEIATKRKDLEAKRTRLLEIHGKLANFNVR